MTLSKKDHVYIVYTDNTLCEYEIKADNFQEIHKFENVGFPDFILYDNKNEALLFEGYTQQHKIQAISLREGAAKNPLEIGPVNFGPESSNNIEVVCWAFIDAERLAVVNRATWGLFLLVQIQG